MRAWRKFISAGGLELIMLSLVEVSAGYSSLRALAFAGAITLDGRSIVGVPPPSHRRARNRPCSGKSTAVSKAQRRGQPEDRRLHPRGAPPFRRAACVGLPAFSAAAGAATPARRHALGRRAADVRDRSRADVAAQAPVDG